MPLAATSTETAGVPRPGPLRVFGRFRLLRLLGKSQRTMAWLVGDPKSGLDLMLVLPRTQLRDAPAAQRWSQAVGKAARLLHPQLAVPVEIGVHENWPYVAYDLQGRATLADRIGSTGVPAVEAVTAVCSMLEGLAYAHDAGIGHHDLQPYLVLVDEQGNALLTGLEVAPDEDGHEAGSRGVSGVEMGALRAQRDAAERDVLASGLILYHALSGQPALDERDVGRVMERLPPQGHEVVRLPWTTAHPIPDVLRAIANRATDRQARQRYRSARTFGRALEGWLRSDDNGGAGPLAMLLDRLASVGLLPASSGGAERAARLALMDRQRTNELAAVVVEDLALAFELLRLVNSAQIRGAQVAGSGPVLTVRRAIAMLGMNGVRRAALSLRGWPGPLAAPAATELAQLIARVKRAGRVAMALRPAGYDAEVIFMITLLQNLGRLVVHYHCADEALQIRRLTSSLPPEKPGEPPQPGMSEEAAAFSVLGVDIESIGAAIARRWGLDDGLLQIVRPLSTQMPVRPPEGDDELLRTVASCANELVDLQILPAAQQATALQRVAQRYGRALHLTPKDLQAALQTAMTTSTADVLLADSGNALYSGQPAESDAEVGTAG